MNTEAIGIAVVGSGRWGNHLVRNFLKHPNAKLLAAVDQHSDRLQRLAKQYDLSPKQQITADKWENLLNRDDLDAVAIATPASTHYTLIESALHHRKHVFVEKPITLNPKEAQELCNLATAVNCQLMVDHTYLFNDSVRVGEHILQQRKLGTLRYGYATRTHIGPVRRDVDALWDLAIHDISIFSHWLHEFPCQVQAQGKIWLQPSNPRFDSPFHVNTDFMTFPRGLSDRVWATLRYPSGIEVMLHLCWANPDKQRRLCLVGDQGTLVFDDLKNPPLVMHPGYIERTEDAIIAHQEQTQTIPTQQTEPLYEACTHFLECIRKQTTSTVSPGQLGAKFVEILSALTESLNSGGTPMAIT